MPTHESLVHLRKRELPWLTTHDPESGREFEGRGEGGEERRGRTRRGECVLYILEIPMSLAEGVMSTKHAGVYNNVYEWAWQPENWSVCSVPAETRTTQCRMVLEIMNINLVSLDYS